MLGGGNEAAAMEALQAWPGMLLLIVGPLCFTDLISR